jgi:hypothetical protein
LLLLLGDFVVADVVVDIVCLSDSVRVAGYASGKERGVFALYLEL